MTTRSNGSLQLLLFAVVTVAGCGGLPPSPSHSFAAVATPSMPTSVASASSGTEPNVRSWTVAVHDPQALATAELAVNDASGLVTDARETLQSSFGFGGRSVHVGLLAGDDRTLAIFVAVAGCQPRPSLNVSSAENRLLIRLDPGQRAAGGCDAMAVEYRVLLSLAHAVALADVVTQDADTDAVTWGVASLGSNGVTSPILVIDRTRQSLLVLPIAPAIAIPDQDGIAVTNPIGDANSLTVVWMSDPCETQATLTIEKIGESLSLVVQSARVEQLTCGVPPIAHAVGLRFSVPMPADAISASVAHNQ
jgi:hypothetical protein